MITVKADICNPFSQKTYDDIISSIPFHQLPCTCGCCGCLIGHGSYLRFIKSEGIKIPISINRVKCTVCEKTHGLLLANIVPYSQIPLHDQVAIISDTSTPAGVATMEANPAIDENNVKYIIRHYHHHWRQRVTAEKIPLQPLCVLVKQCFSLFGRQFMQIKKTPNILFLTPT